MLSFIWLVLCLVAASLILLPLALWQRSIYKRYSGSRLVVCPENRQGATVSIDALRAAASGVDGYPQLRLCECTRWPERSNCGQACIAQAIREEPDRFHNVKPGRKPIHHLPILLAAFATWCLGSIWHSHFMFRAGWMEAIGIDRAQVKQLVSWYSPHLLTAAVCLLFAYGVAWLLTICHRRGVLHGLLMSVVLAGTVVASSWFAIAKLPHDLLAIEAGYAALAILMVGAIVGGLSDKLVLPPE